MARTILVHGIFVVYIKHRTTYKIEFHSIVLLDILQHLSYPENVYYSHIFGYSIHYMGNGLYIQCTKYYLSGKYVQFYLTLIHKHDINS